MLFTLFTFVGKLIPIFNNAYERSIVYSVDNIVEKLIGEEATLKGIYSTFYNDRLYEKDTNFTKIVEDKIKTVNSSESIGRFLRKPILRRPTSKLSFGSNIRRK